MQLGHRRGMIELGEDRAHERGHHLLGRAGHERQQVPHQVDPASLPARPDQDGLDRPPEASVGIGDHQAHAREAPCDQRAQERPPEPLVLGDPHVEAEDVPLSGGRDPDRDDRGEGDHPTVPAHLVERRIQPEVRVGLLDRTPREAFIPSSSSEQIRVTSLLETPSIPRARTRSSTFSMSSTSNAKETLRRSYRGRGDLANSSRSLPSKSNQTQS